MISVWPHVVDEQAARAAILTEARTWLGTPWHHQARLKGVGVDCAQLLIAVYAGVGLIEPFTPAHYPIDWALHRSEARFCDQLLAHCRKVDVGLPGDIAMYRYGRQAAHGGIVAESGTLLHAWRDEGQVTLTELHAPALVDRFAGFYRWKGFG